MNAGMSQHPPFTMSFQRLPSWQLQHEGCPPSPSLPKVASVLFLFRIAMPTDAAERAPRQTSTGGTAGPFLVNSMRIWRTVTVVNTHRCFKAASKDLGSKTPSKQSMYVAKGKPFWFEYLPILSWTPTYPTWGISFWTVQPNPWLSPSFSNKNVAQPHDRPPFVSNHPIGDFRSPAGPSSKADSGSRGIAGNSPASQPNVVPQVQAVPPPAAPLAPELRERAVDVTKISLRVAAILITEFASQDLCSPSSDSVKLQAPARRSRSKWGSHSADPLRWG